MKTNAQHQQEHRKRLKEQGFVRLDVWTKPEHSKKIREFAKELNK